MKEGSQPDVRHRAALNADEAATLRNGTQNIPPVVEPAAATTPKAPPKRPREASGKSSWRNTFSSLSNRDFLFLWLGMLTLMAGMQMQMLARGYLVYDITGSGAILGIVNAGTAIPMLTLSLFGGAFADRIERKRIIQSGQVVVAALALVVGFLILNDRITWYYLMFTSIIQGAMFSFMMPARQAIIPQIVGTDKVTNAMALNAAAMSSMTLAAPALGGGLYAYTGPHNVYFIVSILAFCSVIFTSFIPKAGAGTGKKSKEPMIKDIAEGLRYIKQSHLVMVLLVMGLATTLFAMPFRFLMPVFVVDIYRLEADSMGLLMAVMGGGSLVGSLFIAAIGQWRRGLLLIMGSFMSGIALLLVAAFPIYLAAVLFMIPLGLGDAGRRSLNQSLIMEEVEDRYRGRVMSVFMMNFGLMPLGVLPAGLLIDYFGAQIVVGILGVLMLITTTVILVTQKRLREMP
jgi:MFS family permease